MWSCFCLDGCIQMPCTDSNEQCAWILPTFLYLSSFDFCLAQAPALKSYQILTKKTKYGEKMPQMHFQTFVIIDDWT